MAMSSFQSLLLFNSLYLNSVCNNKQKLYSNKTLDSKSKLIANIQKNTKISDCDEDDDQDDKEKLDSNKMDYLYDSAAAQQQMYHPYNQQYQYHLGNNPQAAAVAAASFYLNGAHSYNYNEQSLKQTSPYTKNDYQDQSLINSSSSCNTTALNSSLNSSLTAPNNQLLAQQSILSTPSSSTSSSCSSLNSSTDYINRSGMNNSSPQYQFLTSPISHYHHNYLSYQNQPLYQSHNISNLVPNTEANYLVNKPERNDLQALKHQSMNPVKTVVKKDDSIGSCQPKFTTGFLDKFYQDHPEKSTAFITPSLMSIEASQRRKRRQRTQFSKYQLSELEKLFHSTRYPDIYCREDLSARIGIPESRIQVWFKNRRSKIRKDEKVDYKQMAAYGAEYLADNREEDDEDDDRDLD